MVETPPMACHATISISLFILLVCLSVTCVAHRHQRLVDMKALPVPPFQGPRRTLHDFTELPTITNQTICPQFPGWTFYYHASIPRAFSCATLGNVTVSQVAAACATSANCSSFTIYTNASASDSYCFNSDIEPILYTTPIISALNGPCDGTYTRYCPPVPSGFVFSSGQLLLDQYRLNASDGLYDCYEDYNAPPSVVANYCLTTHAGCKAFGYLSAQDSASGTIYPAFCYFNAPVLPQTVFPLLNISLAAPPESCYGTYSLLSAYSPPPSPPLPPSPSTPNPPPSSSTNHTALAAGVGGGVGAAVLLALAIFIFCYLRRRQRRKARPVLPAAKVVEDGAAAQGKGGPDANTDNAWQSVPTGTSDVFVSVVAAPSVLSSPRDISGDPGGRSNNPRSTLSYNSAVSGVDGTLTSTASHSLTHGTAWGGPERPSCVSTRSVSEQQQQQPQRQQQMMSDRDLVDLKIQTPAQEDAAHQPGYDATMTTTVLTGAGMSLIVQTHRLATITIPWDSLVIMKDRVCGRGGFGIVYEGLWHDTTPVAVKMLNKDKLTPESLSALRQEALIMCDKPAPFIATVYGLVDENEHHALIMKLYWRGSLSSVMLTPEYRQISIMERLKIAKQVATGMRNLHSRKPRPIIHGDLKRSNLLVENDGKSVVIADFGLAACLRRGDTSVGAASGLSYQISPPEVLQNHLARRTTAGDVFAFGITLLEIMSGRGVYQGAGNQDIARHVIDGGRPAIHPDMPKVIEDIIRECWAQNPEDRPNFDQICQSLMAAMKDESLPASAGPNMTLADITDDRATTTTTFFSK